MGVTWVDAEELRRLVPMPAAIAAVRAGFVGLAAGAFEMPARTVLREGQFLDMAVHHRPSGTAAFKTLSLDFAGRDPAIVGTVVWHDVRRTDVLVADAGALTALRTGAVTGVATDLLAPPDARRCVVIGTGAQAPDQARAVHAVRPLEGLTVVGRDRSRAERLAAELASELPDVRVTATDDLPGSLGEAHVVCCATSARAPLFELDALPNRVHVNAIGSYTAGMRELPDELLAAGLVVVDDRAAALEEAGEVIHATATGALDPDGLVELGDALTHGVSPALRTVFKSVGVAVQDWAVARQLAEALDGSR